MWHNGGTHEGQWADDQRKGLGVEWSEDGAIIGCGSFRAHKLIKEQPVPRRFLPANSKYLSAAMHAAGPDILLLPCGGYYTGAVNAAHQRHGKGVVHARDGSELQRGEWKANKLMRASPAGAAEPRVAACCAVTAAAMNGAAAADIAHAPPANCVICLDRPRDCLIDCPHFCLCFDCAASQQHCPLCRVPITQRTKRRVIVA